MAAASHNLLVVGVLALFASVAVTQDAGNSPQADAASSSGDSKPEDALFDEIDGFALKAHASIQMGRSKERCRAICAREMSCNSFSYRSTDKTCVISEDSLTYDPEFVFGSKSHRDDKEPYHIFEGLTYRSKGWIKAIVRNKAQCQEKCTQAASKCAAFSYRHRDATCLLSATGIEYSPDFSYFEKNRDVHPHTKLVHDQSVGWDQSVADKRKKENPALEALRNKVKKKEEESKMMISAAQKGIAAAKAKVAKLKLETKADIARIHTMDKDELKKMESKFTKASDEKFNKEKDADKIQFAKEEVHTKKKEGMAQLGREKERGRKKVAKIERDEKSRDRKVTEEASRQAQIESKKLRVAAELKETQRDVDNAARREKDAKDTKAKENSEANGVKEKEGKSENAHLQEINVKEAFARGDAEVKKKTNRVMAEKQTAKIREHTNKQVKEMGVKEMHRNSERGSKINQLAQENEAAAKGDLKAARKERQQDESDMEAVREKEQEVQNHILDATKTRDYELEKTRLLSLQKKSQTEKSVFDMNAKQHAAEINNKETISQKLHALKVQHATQLRMVKIEAYKKGELVKEKIKKTAMQKKAHEMNTTLDMISQTRQALFKAYPQWLKEKQELKEERADQREHLLAELNTTKTNMIGELTFEKNLAAEKVGKARQVAVRAVSRGDADGRMRQAEGKERALKIPGERIAFLKKIRGVYNEAIRADAAAFVDSGPPIPGECVKCGLDAPPLHDAMIKFKIQKVQSERERDDEKNKLEAAFLRYEGGFDAANKSFVIGKEMNQKYLERMQNQTQDTINAMNYAISAMPDFASLQQQMTNITSGYNGFGANINTPVLTQFTPTPLPTSAPTVVGEEDQTAVELLELDEDSAKAFQQGDYVDFLEIEPHGNSNVLLSESDRVGESEKDKFLFGDGRRRRRRRRRKTQATGNDDNDSGGSDDDDSGSSGDGESPTATPTAAPTATPTALNSPTATPTAAPTASPTFNATIETAAAQAAANEIAQKASELAILEAKRSAASAKMTAAELQYKSKETFLDTHFRQLKQRLNTTLDLARNESAAAQVTYENATSAFNTAKTAYTNVLRYPANTPYGKLPEQAEHQGYLRIQASDDRTQEAFMKFPANVLKDQDTIMTATLRVYKVSGPGGPIQVEVVSCLWSRATLTYTKSMNMGYQRVSRGVLASFTDGGPSWQNISLRGDAIQNARLAGEHICLAIKGGPSDAPAILGSELTSQAPVLDVEYKEANPDIKVDLPNITPKSAKEQKSPEEICREKIKQELTLQMTRAALSQIRIEASGVAQGDLLAGTQQNQAESALQGMQMATEMAALVNTQVETQTSSIMAAAQNGVEQQLNNMANAGASAGDLQSAATQLSVQASSDSMKAANAAAANIQQSAQAGLEQMEKTLENDTSERQNKLQAQVDDLRQRGAQLTAQQKADIEVRVAEELANRASECDIKAPPPPPPGNAAAPIVPAAPPPPATDGSSSSSEEVIELE